MFVIVIDRTENHYTGYVCVSNLDLNTLMNLNVDILTKPEGLVTPAILVILLPGV